MIITIDSETNEPQVAKGMRILYVTTTFPVLTETFLQREVRAFRSLGTELKIVSLHKGEAEFDGMPVCRFRKWRLFSLFWRLPFALIRHWKRVLPILRPLWRKEPPNQLNLWENLLGFGAALAMEKQVRAFEPDCIHCVWCSAPAAFGWLSSKLLGLPFSVGAHAYDIFEDGGDWFLKEKLDAAQLVHVSTEVARHRVLEFCSGSKIALVRRGLNELPPFGESKSPGSPLRVICIARLVEKKGFPFQLSVYEELLRRGFAFRATIVGDGPLRSDIEQRIRKSSLEGHVQLAGKLSPDEARARLQEADVILHTGVIARSGDRDGLPNVIPEAMASGVVALATPVSGVVEAVADEETGLLREPDAALWADAVEELARDPERYARLRRGGRRWVEENFRAKVNSKRLLAELSSRLEIERAKVG